MTRSNVGIRVEQDVPDPRRRSTSTPSSSASSRTSAATGASPGSTLPPGNSHCSGRLWSARRCVISTRPSSPMISPATTSLRSRMSSSVRSTNAVVHGGPSACRYASTRPRLDRDERRAARAVDSAVDARRGQLARELRRQVRRAARPRARRACDRRERTSSGTQPRPPRGHAHARPRAREPVAARKPRRAEPVVAQHVDAARRAARPRACAPRGAGTRARRRSHHPTRDSCSRTPRIDRRDVRLRIARDASTRARRARASAAPVAASPSAR